jgi:hypothetical protein
MRAYDVSSEENARTRDLLKDWADEGLLTEEQYQHMQREIVCELRRTNIFLRLVLFLFTVLIVVAAVALFFVLFLSSPGAQTTGIVLLIFAGLTYAGAEFAVSRARLYRYGIEEALAVCAVALLCTGLQSILFSGGNPASPNGLRFVTPGAGAIASLWIWHRFGFAYASLAAMIGAAWVPVHWTSSNAAQHMIIATIYAAGLIALAALRVRHRFDYLNEEYSIAEALLWLGTYLAINVQLSSGDLFGQWWNVTRTTGEFSRPFYWTSWVLTWCLPPVILLRGLRLKDQFVIAVGAITAIMTLATNKSYLGWQRNTWDPMLLGALLIAVALFIRRLLASGPGGIRYGFTARRLSAKDKHRMSAGAAVVSLDSHHPVALNPQAGNPGVRFGGGDSGGAGASSDF